MEIQVKIAKRLSKASSISILIALIMVMVLVLLVPALGEQSGIAKFISDLFDSNTLRDVAYQGMDGKKNLGWGSAIAYAIGVIIMLGILVPVITNRLRTLGDRYLNGTLDQYHWEKHVLFIGYDELMIGTLKKACVDNNLVVVAVPGDVQQVREQISKFLSKDMGKVEIVQCNQNNIIELEKKARIMEASRIFIIGQPDNPTHDANNLRTLADIAKKWHDKEQSILKKDADYEGVPHIMVYLRNQSTFSLLQRQGFSAENLWNIIDAPLTETGKKSAQAFVDRHCEYFNFYCDKALLMLSTSPDKGGMSLAWHSSEKNIAKSGMENRQVHFVVLGMTQMGTALVRELLKLAHPSGKGTKLLVTMVDENAREEMHYFIGRTKELFKLCHYRYFDYDNPSMNSEYKPQDDFLDVEFEFIQCDVAHPCLTDNLLAWSTDETQLLTLVICTNDSPKNMAVAMYLPPEMLCGDNAVPTWVYQEGDDSARHLLNREKYPNMHPFSFADHAIAGTANSPVYEWDRIVVKYYEQHYRTKNVATQWENKPQDNRWSSLYSIKSIGIKLLAVGVLDVTHDIKESKKLLIDYYEHNRWVIERLTMGFRPTNVEQHTLVKKELEQLLMQYPDWKTNEKSRRVIANSRTIFNELKEGTTVPGVRIHDDIRRFDDLTQYTKDIDRKTLDDYLESIRKNPRVS